MIGQGYTKRRIMIDEYTKRLSSELEIPIEKDEEKNVTLFRLNRNVEVTMTELDPGVLFFSRIITVHKDHREDLFSYIMRANLLGRGTFQSTIGMEVDEKFLTLSRCIPYEVNYPNFRDALEVFVNTLVLWREEVSKKHEQTKQNIL